MAPTIPTIDIGPLLDPAATTDDRARADAAIAAAAAEAGFMVLTGFPATVPLHRRSDLFRIFDLPEPARMAMARRKYRPDARNVYRGYFPVLPGEVTAKEGVDLGPDIRPEIGASAAGDDPLTEPTPLPDPADLPGWQDAAAAYHAAMETVGHAVLGAVARALGVPERVFTDRFENGISTLRIIRYPAADPADTAALAARDPEARAITADGPRRVIGKAHVDSGFVTLLQLDGVGGLQARLGGGAAGSDWVDVPVLTGALVVNFGGLLERWTGGRVRATEHRVLAPDGERRSVPFFFEPAADAIIAPIDDLPDADRFEPFVYGDYLWDAMQAFVEFKGIPRTPTGPV